jgi:hypothetical protein
VNSLVIELCRALAIYLAKDKMQGFSQGALIDYLCISTPFVLDLSDFSESEREQIVSLLVDLTDAEIQIQDAAKYL